MHLKKIAGLVIAVAVLALIFPTVSFSEETGKNCPEYSILCGKNIWVAPLSKTDEYLAEVIRDVVEKEGGKVNFSFEGDELKDEDLWLIVSSKSASTAAWRQKPEYVSIKVHVELFSGDKIHKHVNGYDIRKYRVANGWGVIKCYDSKKYRAAKKKAAKDALENLWEY